MSLTRTTSLKHKSCNECNALPYSIRGMVGGVAFIGESISENDCSPSKKCLTKNALIVNEHPCP